MELVTVSAHDVIEYGSSSSEKRGVELELWAHNLLNANRVSQHSATNQACTVSTETVYRHDRIRQYINRREYERLAEYVSLKSNDIHKAASLT